MRAKTITRRVTSPFLKEILLLVKRFDASVYASVQDVAGNPVILDPCIFHWDQKTITMTIPNLDETKAPINFTELHEDFFEAVEAAFLVVAAVCSH